MATKTSESKPKSPVDENPKGGGIPKWVIVVIIIVAVLYALFYVGGMMIGNAMKNRMGLAGVQMNNDGKSFSIHGKNGESMQVGENVTLPANFPQSMPMYPGGKLQSAVDAKEAQSITYFVKGADMKTVAYWYRKELPKNGWTNELDKMDGGFIPVKNGYLSGVIAIVTKDDTTSVTINISSKK
jgi:hypothetical protein